MNRTILPGKKKAPFVSWADIYTLLLRLHYHHFFLHYPFLLHLILEFYLYLKGLTEK